MIGKIKSGFNRVLSLDRRQVVNQVNDQTQKVRDDFEIGIKSQPMTRKLVERCTLYCKKGLEFFQNIPLKEEIKPNISIQNSQKSQKQVISSKKSILSSQDRRSRKKRQLEDDIKELNIKKSYCNDEDIFSLDSEAKSTYMASSYKSNQINQEQESQKSISNQNPLELVSSEKQQNQSKISSQNSLFNQQVQDSTYPQHKQSKFSLDQKNTSQEENLMSGLSRIMKNGGKKQKISEEDNLMSGISRFEKDFQKEQDVLKENKNNINLVFRFTNFFGGSDDMMNSNETNQSGVLYKQQKPLNKYTNNDKITSPEKDLNNPSPMPAKNIYKQYQLKNNQENQPIDNFRQTISMPKNVYNDKENWNDQQKHVSDISKKQFHDNSIYNEQISKPDVLHKFLEQEQDQIELTTTPQQQTDDLKQDDDLKNISAESYPFPYSPECPIKSKLRWEEDRAWSIREQQARVKVYLNKEVPHLKDNFYNSLYSKFNRLATPTSIYEPNRDPDIMSGITSMMKIDQYMQDNDIKYNQNEYYLPNPNINLSYEDQYQRNYSDAFDRQLKAEYALYNQFYQRKGFDSKNVQNMNAQADAQKDSFNNPILSQQNQTNNIYEPQNGSGGLQTGGQMIAIQEQEKNINQLPNKDIQLNNSKNNVNNQQNQAKDFHKLQNIVVQPIYQQNNVDKQYQNEQDQLKNIDKIQNRNLKPDKIKPNGNSQLQYQQNQTNNLNKQENKNIKSHPSKNNAHQPLQFQQIFANNFKKQQNIHNFVSQNDDSKLNNQFSYQQNLPHNFKKPQNMIVQNDIQKNTANNKILPHQNQKQNFSNHQSIVVQNNTKTQVLSQRNQKQDGNKPQKMVHQQQQIKGSEKDKFCAICNWKIDKKDLQMLSCYIHHIHKDCMKELKKRQKVVKCPKC